MRNACDSDSRCGLACDASTRDAKSLAMWVERCEPLRCGWSWLVLFFLGLAKPRISRSQLQFFLGAVCELLVVIRVHAKGVVLCERACFCLLKHLLSAFYTTLPSKDPSKNPCPYRNPYKARRLLRTLLRRTSFKEPSKNPSKKRAVAWPPWCAP